ncbi:hypothetical protein [Mucilaginibacter celer]|uniref:hypothetical protein n=1 Tax=Mucilaginibacter celer TaxID=2305508 RepID=UPI0013CEC462|nr:hypothetical protein [Mucilaginibacter celer]
MGVFNLCSSFKGGTLCVKLKNGTPDNQDIAKPLKIQKIKLEHFTSDNQFFIKIKNKKWNTLFLKVEH